jgi:hypothetical protein
MAKPPIRPSGDGNFEVDLDPSVVELLEHMCSELEALLASDSPLLTRLFPPPYGDDTERNEGYAALAVPELIDHRIEAIASLRSSLAADRLTPEELMAWMRTLNDMRLVLGTLLGVEDDVAAPEVPEDMADTLAVYEFLGFLLEVVVAALTEGTPDDGWGTG